MVTLTIAVLFIAACSQGQQYECSDGTMVSDKSECPETTPEEGTEDMNEETDQTDTQNEQPEEQTDTSDENESSPAPQEEEEQEVDTKDIGSDVKEMISTMEEKVNSYSYVYVGPPENRPARKYYVKGNTIVVELEEKEENKKANMTHVYLNTETKEATASCESRDTSWCPDGAVPSSVDYEDYYIKTPYQWFTSLKTATHTGNGPSYEGRSTEIVEFATDSKSGEMQVLAFYSIPGKIEFDDGSTIAFRDLSVNSVSDDRVTKPE